jgi:tetratricopeptide (TPR) repeat protein
MAEKRKTEIIEEAILLRDQKEYEASNDLLLKLAKAYPGDASINYQCAWSFDLLGHKEKAVSYYENAIRLGLNGEELEGALLGLGSTYRTLGEYDIFRKHF